MKTEDCFRIGTVLKTKGLKGELQIFVDFDGLDDIDLKTIFLDISGKLVPYFVESYKSAPKTTAYLFLEDIDTIEKATPLVRKDIYLSNKQKPKKRKSDFTLKDLKGFIAVDINEGELGEILEVHDYSKQLVATVKYKDCEVLFPLNEDIIKAIDVVKGIVTIDLPEGLLEIYLD